ncbi:titin [Ictalurus furcatus]|uniref:titin n=1 Tax=Ictalurus furcatus TaxID=66913 RepID=UPI002350A7B9|nr:titin [Ictalurus furcatus]
MMPFKTTSLLCLIFLLMITGALGNEWKVTYIETKLCALKGSTVFMNVTYTHPTRLTVKNRFWLIDPVHGKELTDLRNDSGYSDRVEYLGDEQKHFSLRLSDVKKSDEQKYWFRIITNEEKERWLGHPGVRLTVTDLQVIAPAEVTEGQSVVLTCKTTCSLTDPTFIWYKNRRDLTTNTPKSNELHLQLVSSEDAGSYSCAVRGYEHLPSPDQTLRVRYPPKNVSVSISSSGEIVEGSSVTLTCSSDANPRVKIYTWFKGTTSVGKEKTYTISKISSEDSGEYKCKCSNEVGHQDSISVTLNVLYPPKNVSVSISSSGEKVEGSSVTLTCSSDANPPVENYTWFKENESSPVGSGQSYGALQSGQYYCEAQNQHGSERSAAVSVTLNSGFVIMYVAIGVGLFGLVALLSVLFWLRSRRQKKKADEGDSQNVGPSAKDDTFLIPVLLLTRPLPLTKEQNMMNEMRFGYKHNIQLVKEGKVEPRTRRPAGSAQQFGSKGFCFNTLRIFPVMMSFKMASPLHLVFLFMISGALGNEWSVTYSKLNLCALNGSTVFMNVTYTHPTYLTVKNRFWLINPVKDIEPTDLRNEPGYSGRVEYLGDEQKHFSLRLSDVKKSDEHRYCFRIITNVDRERFLSYPGVRLTVTDLQVIAPAEVTEGQSVVLICNTTCSLTDPTFIWYKNRRDLTTNTTKSNELHLQPVSSEDAGSYSCAVRGYEHLPSPAQTLRVRYPPKNVSVSISSSGEIVEGSSVTLTCSSDANPPVKNYTWFKGTTSVGKEKTYTISKISSEDSGEYKCKCSNEVGHQDSISVTLNVLYPPKNVSVSISSSGEIVEGSSVTLTCSSDANPPVENYTWFKGTTSVGKGNTYNISKISSEDSGEYKCKCSNEVGHQDSISVTLNVLYPPKNVSVSISSSGEIVEGSSVTLTCSSDANPPVENYTWFKGTTSVGKEKTYTISKIRSEDSGEYKCNCSNEVGHQDSISVTLNVLYPPKNVSVSISSSGEIVEGSSVTLTCSSDANPPVENYTWFRVNESSPVGSGQTYGALQSGQYYCEAPNQHGSERSAAVSVTLNRFQSLGVYAGVGAVVFVCVCLIITFLFIRSRRQKKKADDGDSQNLLTFSTPPLRRPSGRALKTTRTQLSTSRAGHLMMCITHLQLLIPVLLLTRPLPMPTGQNMMNEMSPETADE